MRTARAKINVDILLVTAPMTVAGDTLQPGDVIVTCGDRQWGMKYEDAAKKLVLGQRSKELLEVAKILHDTIQPKRL